MYYPTSNSVTIKVLAKKMYVASLLLCGWLGPERSEKLCWSEVITAKKRRFR